VRGLAYYFAFKGAAPSTTYQVNVRAHSGALVYVGVSYSLGRTNVWQLSSSFHLAVQEWVQVILAVFKG
jgi:hypothetical protein